MFQLRFTNLARFARKGKSDREREKKKKQTGIQRERERKKKLKRLHTSWATSKVLRPLA